jgi:soluble P-type ATPase
LEVDILTVGNLEVNILMVNNLEVGILTVGNLEAYLRNNVHSTDFLTKSLNLLFCSKTILAEKFRFYFIEPR